MNPITKKTQTKNIKKKTQLFIVSGPSGSGKNAVAKGVLKKLSTKGLSALRRHSSGASATSGEKNATRMVTCTTRPPRPKEKHSKDYYFLTKKEFKKRIKKNEFLEWTKVHENIYVGTLKKELKKLEKKYKIILMTIDVQGANSIRKKAIPHTSIFINAESKKKLISRIKKRKGGMPADKLKLRLASALKEAKQAKKYDYQVINYENKLDETINKVYKIIKNG